MSKAFSSFGDAARATLSGLQARIPLAMWMIWERRGNEGVVLHRRDRFYGVKEGFAVPWEDTLCARMVEDGGPHVVADVREVPKYRDARLTESMAIGAYIGMPLYRRDGTLLGSLCGFDPKPQAHSILLHEPVITLTASLLSTIFDYDEEIDRNAQLASQNVSFIGSSAQASLLAAPSVRAALAA